MNPEQIAIPNWHASDSAAAQAVASADADKIGTSGATVIVNADDWGRNAASTNRSLDCLLCNTVSSVSAMVFMEDSERAAEIAREYSIDAGLHLNLTVPFSAPGCSPRLIEDQQKLSRFLTSHRFAPIFYHPRLASAFDYVVKAQCDEFERLFGTPAKRLDGHHHMHLCTNVIFQNLLPADTIVRRNFSFGPGEKSYINRLYRSWQDRALARRHRIADLFFALMPLEPGRLANILAFAHCSSVEIEAHPVNLAEYQFLIAGELEKLGDKVGISRGYRLGSRTDHACVPINGNPASVIRSRTRNTAVIDDKTNNKTPHITVCICTYKRPGPLKRLVTDISRQRTAGLFTYSIVVADNDEAKSAEAVITELRSMSGVQMKYVVEPRRGIALARNKVVENAEGEFVALIDDDEFPSAEWLLSLFQTCKDFNVDGVLGPVKRHFDQNPPAWLQRSKLYDRRVNPTGTPVNWKSARTGNVLLKRQVLAGDASPFRPEFRTGEDQDFFRRKIEEGRSFVWSAEAEVFEVIPPARWRRRYMVRKALLNGANAALHPNYGFVSILKSIVAVPLYALALPFFLLLGQHHFMALVVKLSDHAGKLLSLLRINPVREQYIDD